MDAVTGKSNFDISEGIIIHLVNLLRHRCRFAQFALLTKFTVLRNLVQYFKSDAQVGNFEFHKIDAGFHFGASVEAGLLMFQIGGGLNLRPTCHVFSNIGGVQVEEIGICSDHLIFDLPTYKRTSFMESAGQPHYVWRQGVKHDLRNVLELTETDSGLKNRHGEDVDIEPETLHQLFKSSDIFHGRQARYVIPIYQRDLKDTLEDLEIRFPKLYKYLQKHEAEFLGRRSSIYKKRPTFTMFGIGEYTHATYKVAIGGLYSTPVFRLLQPNPRLAVVDDTGYMLATNDLSEGLYLLAVLTLDCTRDFLLSISHVSEKRRFSKDVLARVFIPPMKDCPDSIIRSLVDSWSGNSRFTLTVSSPLQEWLSTYSKKGNMSFAFE